MKSWRAIRNESSAAVAHWWSLNVFTVKRWRKRFGLGRERIEESRPSRRGFASLSPEQRKRNARAAGRKAHALGRAHEFTHAEAVEAGRKGGLNRKRPRRPARIKRPRVNKVTIRVYLDHDTIKGLLKAMRHLGGTAADVITAVMQEAASGLEKQNGGKPFPARKAEK